MATTLDQICDLFLSRITDYRLTALFQSSGSSALNTYLEPFLLDSVDEFSGICTQTLTYSTNTQSFDADLTQKNKNILSRIMVRFWLEKEVKDVQQMRMHVQDKDYKTYSEQQNMRTKMELLTIVKEEISQLLVDYGFDNNNWTQWNLQNFV